MLKKNDQKIKINNRKIKNIKIIGKQNLDNFSAKKIAACYGSLDDSHKDQFRFMVNKDAATFQSALDFAIRNV